MKKIIVPTDFSACARNALKVASDIARKGDFEIHLLHVYEQPLLRFAKARADTDESQKVYQQMEQELTQMASLPFMKGIKTNINILTDIKIWEAINHHSDTDLIVMGSHGTNGWREIFLGSNTEKVVRFSETPVLVIKDWHENFEINNMVFVSGFYNEEDEPFIKIENLARLFSAKIHLLKVITPGNFEPTYKSTNLMKDFVRRHYLTEFSINTYNDDTIEDGVWNFCKTIKADLISMETHGRTGIAHLINGSITENIINHIHLPVVSIKIKYAAKRRAVHDKSLFPAQREKSEVEF